MRIYGLKTCDTCRKAIRALGDAEFIDIREDPLSGDLKARALAVVAERSASPPTSLESHHEMNQILILYGFQKIRKRVFVET